MPDKEPFLSQKENPREKKGNVVFLEHTADIMYQARGKNFKEALENAARAFFSVITVIEKTKKGESFAVEVDAVDKEELVVEFLSALLSGMEVREIVLADVAIHEIMEFKGKYLLKATAYGEKRRPRNLVKAVTYHDLIVEENEKGAMIQVVLDV